MTRLDEIEIEEVQQLPEEQKTQFEITDLGAATWAFRKMRSLEKKINEVNEVAQVEIDRVKEWQEKEIKGIQQSIEYFQNLLTFYYVREKEADPKFKCSTPYGSVTSRRLQPKWETNDETLIKWLKENEHTDLIRVKEEPALSDIKDKFKMTESGVVVDDNGLLVEGITIIEQGAKITVKTKGE
jgi:hypothetical protein